MLNEMMIRCDDPNGVEQIVKMREEREKKIDYFNWILRLQFLSLFSSFKSRYCYCNACMFCLISIIYYDFKRI